MRDLETLTLEAVEDLQPILQKKDASRRGEVLGLLLRLICTLRRLAFIARRLASVIEEDCRLAQKGPLGMVEPFVLDEAAEQVRSELLQVGALLREITIAELMEFDADYWQHFWGDIGRAHEIFMPGTFKTYLRKQKGKSRIEQRLFDHFAVPGTGWRDDHEIMKPFKKFELIFESFRWWAEDGDALRDADVRVRREMEIRDALVALSAGADRCVQELGGVMSVHWDPEELLGFGAASRGFA